MFGTTPLEVSCLATEEEGPSLDLQRLSGIVLDETALSRLPRGTEIFVYMGFMEDPTTLSPVGYGTLLGYDPQRKEVHYRTIPDPPYYESAPQGGLRAMITDKSSGLLLPAGARDDEPPVEKRVILEEGYLIMDSTAYTNYCSDPQNWNPGDTLYG